MGIQPSEFDRMTLREFWEAYRGKFGDQLPPPAPTTEEHEALRAKLGK